LFQTCYRDTNSTVIILINVYYINIDDLLFICISLFYNVTEILPVASTNICYRLCTSIFRITCCNRFKSIKSRI